MSGKDKDEKKCKCICTCSEDRCCCLEVYRLTLEAILKAQQQFLRNFLPEAEAGKPPACRVPTSCPTGFQGRYTVKPGDSMFTIAKRCDVPLNKLIEANPHIANPNEIYPCDVLCVPPRCAKQEEDVEATCRVPTSCPPGFQGRYTVKPGDTMFTIAQKCWIPLQALINANPHITNPNEIFPCDVLCVPQQCANRMEMEASWEEEEAEEE